MSTVRNLHDKAMALTQRAMIARHGGHRDEARRLAKQALDYEQQAANLVPVNASSEPTRSILYRSAASLAYQCEELDQARQLIGKALAGYPSAEMKRELDRLCEEGVQ